MRTSHRIVTAFVSAIALFGLAACGSSASNSPSGAGAGESAASSAGAAGQGGKYAIVLKTLSSEFWQNMKTGIEEKAKELNVTVDVFAGNSEDDLEGQVALVENALSQGYVGIGVAPISADNLVNVVAQATAKGTPVVNIDEKLNMEALKAANGAVIGFATTNNVAVGEMGAKFILDKLGNSGGEVAIIEGKAGTASGEARKNGATEALKKDPKIKLVDSQPADWDRTKAMDLATNYIAKYPNLKAIYCANDTMAMGAQQAVTLSGKNIVVVGTDGNSDAVSSVQDGQLAATVKQDSPSIGAKSLEMLVNFVNSGKKFDKSTTGEDVFIDAILVKKS